MAYLLEKLKDTMEGDKNLLDKTVVVWGSPMADPNVHNHRRCPLILLGHANGALKGNLHLKAADGTPMANAFLTMHSSGHGRHEAVRRQHRRVVAHPGGAGDGGVCEIEFSGGGHRVDRRSAIRFELQAWIAMKRQSSVLAMIALSCRRPRRSSRSPVADAASAATGGGARAAEAGRRRQRRAGRRHERAALGRRARRRGAGRLLIYAGANIGAVTRIGQYTPLHLAAKRGSAAVTKALLKAGADVNVQVDNSGVTPLHLAASSGSAGRGQRAARRGADVNAKESKPGQTPLIFAAG